MLGRVVLDVAETAVLLVDAVSTRVELVAEVVLREELVYRDRGRVNGRQLEANSEKALTRKK